MAEMPKCDMGGDLEAVKDTLTRLFLETPDTPLYQPLLGRINSAKDFVMQAQVQWETVAKELDVPVMAEKPAEVTQEG